METALIVIAVLNLIIIIALLFRIRAKNDDSKLESTILSYFREEEKILSSQLSALREESAKNNLLMTEKTAESLDKIRTASSEGLRAVFIQQQNEKKSLDENFLSLSERIKEQLEKIRTEEKDAQEALLKMNRDSSDCLRAELERIRGENDKKLEAMRQTVDEKLQKTLDERLAASFEIVTKNLNSLREALGEINRLSKDVGDLNKLFGNVKSRGVWGEVQAEAILSDILTSDQYEKNFHPRKNGAEVVEFAIKLPGKENGNVYIPIDSKFPKEDYERYVESTSRGNKDEIDASLKALRERIRKEASDIDQKYINPPRTTDFAILFLPTESLYAEILRQAGFTEDIQMRYKVIISGPTTFSALITSLNMGFRTLQIEKRTKEVWHIFAQIKKQMSTFAEELEASKKAIEGASSKIDKAIKRSGMLQIKMEKIELPEARENESFADSLNGESSTYTELPF
ncbi:MAG TPA: DNA recombination protein RmuC [Candidatus Ornithospirochaeta avicola]|uniref:DNA recombination protein RmuC n=1 Tax=Candidatus Ornithospirochaeta avicola TaxID=2840896 RepID=A0A9D1TM83_9SPIO|nr:DNA recombination protein RmuC [Candidatus Ornithospirochaeta avicola]